MTGQPFTCPYCNAQVTTPERDDAGRACCPRCGDLLPTHLAPGPAVETATTVSPPPTPAAVADVKRPLLLAGFSVLVVAVSGVLALVLPESTGAQKALPFMVGLGGLGLIASLWLWFLGRPRTNNAIAGFLLGNMLVVALVMVPIILLTTPERRKNDPPPLKKEPGPSGLSGATKGPSGPYAPAGLPALGYLPANTRIVIGLHLSELLQEPSAKVFLDKSQWLPLEMVLKNLQQWTGLQAEAIDHAVFGITSLLPLPHFTVVVQTREPFDPQRAAAAFAKRQIKTRVEQHLDRPVYVFNPPKADLTKGLLWCAGDYLLVLEIWSDGTHVEDRIQALPVKPRSGASLGPAAVRTIIAERLPRGTPVWLAGRSPEPLLLALLLPVRPASKEDWLALRQVEAFDLGLSFHDDVTLLGGMQAKDADAAAEVRRFLERQKVEGLGSPRVYGGRVPAEVGTLVVGLALAPGVEAVSAWTALLAAEARLRLEQKAAHGNWVTFQLRGSPEALREALRAPPKLLPIGEPPG
jgi:hypothetical protein